MMDWFSRAFIRSSVVWLALGVTLGVAMAVDPRLIIYRPAHMHMNLLGFVAMMIFGVAYHVIPRFAGAPLRQPRLAGAHWWVANAGLTLMVTGFVLRPGAGQPAVATFCLATGGVLSALGAYAFAFNVWGTFGARPPAASAAPGAGRPEALLRVVRRS
jgi:cbb3-type cytochrome oxidase subunit 1